MKTVFQEEYEKLISLAGSQNRFADVVSDLTGNEKIAQAHVWEWKKRGYLSPDVAIKVADWAIEQGETVNLSALCPGMDWELARKLLT